MTHRPRISAVVPGKDVAPFLADALTSLGRQVEDPRDLEVIVIDDGSTDATADVARQFTGRLPGLTVLTNPEPSGLANARNQGLAAATGRYVAFLDADDWLAPGRLAHLADASDALRVPFVRTDHTTVRGRRRDLIRAPQSVRGVPLDPRGSILPVHTSTMVDYPYAWAGIFDRALAEDGLLAFPPDLHTAEDRPWIWRLFLSVPRYAVVDAPTLCYRRGIASSLTAIYDRRQLDILKALRQAYDLVQQDRDADAFLPKITRTSLALVAHHVARSANMPPDVRRDLRAGARAFFEGLPRDVLAAEVRVMRRARARTLHRVLPRGVDRHLAPHLTEITA
ncbi:glycosyltransferase family 2 protein [Isoptericola sp. BMS4]|uniref:glycosyltransferase family 2 protein n=1 Tax=Isoptericola sp. BMS4 TaxID=2527875 RepID=UPI00141F3852|nr:glycosyltransferase family 2 protein [Isoptericola sp. BMS4]